MTGPAKDEVRLDIDGHLARVTIDRPAVLNAVDSTTHERLDEIWRRIESSPQVRCVVVTGSGERAFCVGADMSGSDTPEATGLRYWSEADPNGFGGLSMRTTLDVPVIARVNGYALGGGMEMALGCDILVAAEHAEFGLTEPRVGRLPLDGGMVLLQRKVPHNLAMGMLLTGRRVPAAEMYRMGLVNEVVAADDLDAAVGRWVDDVLACSPLAVRAIKQLATRTRHLAADEARNARLPAVIAALVSEDSLEGLLAFREKRRPAWSGR